MISRSLKRSVNRLFTVVLAGLFLVLVAANPQEQANPDLKGIPGKVMDALKAKFPNSEIQKWSKEQEGSIVLYDIEFKQGGNKLEADITEDGAIDNWEREIPAKDLPAAARKAVDSGYPKGVIKEVMATTAVKDGKDVPEGYEITLESADKKAVEVTVASDGKVLEDSGAEK